MSHIHLCICSFYRFLLFSSNPNGAHPNVWKSSAFCFHSWIKICIETKNANNIILTIHMCLVYMCLCESSARHIWVKFITKYCASSHLDCWRVKLNRVYRWINGERSAIRCMSGKSIACEHVPNGFSDAATRSIRKWICVYRAYKRTPWRMSAGVTMQPIIYVITTPMTVVA